MKQFRKAAVLAQRTLKEMLRDPLTLFFGLAFPILILLLLSLIQSHIPVDMFRIEQLAPGIVVFGQSFLSLFGALLIARDRSTSFLMRLYAAPVTALSFLLGYLLPLLPLERKVAGLEAPGFPQAEQIFHLMGWETCAYDPADPKGDWPGLLMISPANPYKGRALTEKERNNLIVATQLERVYLLEDDYNGEFRYLHRPTPALHSFGNREQIIYLGSFSRTMLPSLRISFLVLPEKLLPAYRAIAGRYNQTSSTVEQLALAAYIEEGHLTRHIRKLRTLYRTKSRLLQEALTAVFGDQVRLLGYGSGLHLHIALDRSGTAEELAARALEKGVRVIPVRGTEPGRPPEFLLSFAGIGEEKIRAGVEALREALEE